ncbi:MAG TPA: RNA polymerase sigma factor [Polyangiaceae bacterium]|jgi:RNA polymerase sigma-70 factor (ECF subfamily)|nr:RNA polymerase sigma factor [Polyangiaceae bacterium]
MARYASGDEPAFAEVYDSVAPRLYSYLLRRTGDVSAAEDLVQQTLLHMHRARGSFVRGSLVLPWAFAIARRLFIDRMRRNRHETLFDREFDETALVCSETAEHSAEAQQLATRLSDELKRLPVSQREAFEFLRIDGMSHAEAAAALGITVSAVKLRAHRAYLALHVVASAIFSANTKK